jgi:hypothetical protein
VKRLLLLTLIAGCVTAARDRDPVIGTWQLDVARSSFSPGPPLRSQQRTYEETPLGVKFTLTGVSASGKPMLVEYTAPYDGKDYPLHGSPSVDAVALTRIDRFTAEAREKRGGQVMFTVSRIISSDGRTMTVTSTGTNAEGTSIRNVLVFVRQR